MDKPTQEQIKEFWEWCGFTGKLDYIEDTGEREGKLVYVYPPIDLNNLFKYAVLNPKLNLAYPDVLLCDWIEGFITQEEDPALALFWAVWQVKEINEK